MTEFTLDTTHTADETVKIPEVGVDGIVTDHRYEVLSLTREVTKAWQKLGREVKDRQKERAEMNGDAPDDDADEAARLYIRGIALRLKPLNGAPPAGDVLDRLWDESRLSIDRHLMPLLKHLFGGETEPDPPA